MDLKFILRFFLMTSVIALGDVAGAAGADHDDLDASPSAFL